MCVCVYSTVSSVRHPDDDGWTSRVAVGGGVRVRRHADLRGHRHDLHGPPLALRQHGVGSACCPAGHRYAFCSIATLLSTLS